MTAHEDHQDREEALAERIAAALERLADHGDDTIRVAQLEMLLETFVDLMGQPQASDEAWVTLLDEIKEALA